MSRFGRSYIRPVTRITPQPNPIRQYTVNSADTASGTDALARAFRGTRASADTGVGVDSLTRSFIGTRNLPDSSAATDVLTSVKRFPRSIADNALASDTMVRAFTGSRAIADAGLGLDTLTRRFIGARTASDYSTLVLSDSPTSYWNLSETTGLYADIVAGNNGTATGASFVRGATPLVAGGDGAWQGSTASYINLGDVLDFPSGAAFTLEAWVTFALDGAASRAIMTKTGVDGGGQQGWLLVVTQATANLDLRMYRDGVLTLARGGSLVTGINHCVGTFDGSNLRVYINGTLVGGPIAAGTGLLNNTFNANIGAWTAGNNWTNKIDEVAVYSYALSAAQVQRHYNVGLNGGDTLAPTNDAVTRTAALLRNAADVAAGVDTVARTFVGTRARADTSSGIDAVARRFVGSRQPSDYKMMIVNTSGVQSYWRFSETTGAATVADSVGAVTGTYNSNQNAGLSLIAGDSDQSLIAASSPARYAYFGDVYNFSGTAAFTFEAWVNPTTFASFNRRVFSKRLTDGGGIEGYELTLNTGGVFSFARYLSNASLGVGSLAGAVTGTTYHVVATYDGTTTTLYINGASQGQTTDTRSILPTTGVNFTVGQFSGGGNGWDGRIDEFVVYNRALTATEVQRHYNLGLNGGEALAPTGDTTARQYISVRQGIEYKSTILDAGPSSYWRLGDTSGNWIDIVGGRDILINNGAVNRGTSGLITLDADKSVQFATISGQSNSLRINYDANLTGLSTNFSVEFWLIADATLATGTNGILRNEASPVKGFDFYASGTAGSFNAPLSVQWGQGGTTTFPSTSSIDWSTPHYCALTYDGTTLRMYVDGVQRASTVTTYAPNDGTTTLIGVYGVNQTWPGRMDELAWYSRVLSAAEVADHYNAGAKAGSLSTNSGDRAIATETSARQFVGARTPTDTTSAVDSVTRRFIGSRTTPDGLNAIDVQNLVPNPDFEVNTTGWSTQTSNGGTATLDTSWYYSGRLAFRINGTQAPGGYIWMFTSQGTSGMPITGGATYFARADMYNWSVGTSSQQQDLRIYWWDVSGTLLTTPTVQMRNGAAVTLGYLRYEGTLVAPVNAHYAMIGAYMSGATGDFLDFSADNFVFGLNSPARAVVSSRTITDISAAVDTNARQFIGSRAQTDAITGVDTNTRQFVGTRLSADNALGVDAVARSGRFSRTTPDTTAGVDSVTRHTVQARLIADIAAAVDTWARHFVGARTLADTASALDVLARSGRFTRATADTVTATDLVARFTIVFRRLFVDLAPAVDSVSRNFIGGRVLSEYTEIRDNPTYALKRYPIAAQLSVSNDQSTYPLVEDGQLKGTLLVNNNRVNVVKVRPRAMATEIMTREFLIVNNRSIFLERKQVNLISGASAE